MFLIRMNYQRRVGRVQGGAGRCTAIVLATTVLVALPGLEAIAADPAPVTETRSATRIAMKPVLGRVTEPKDLAIADALRMIAECKTRYQAVEDYSCDFYKRERVNGKLTPLHVMTMKERTKPKSIYLKFQSPNRGREAIYVEGRNRGNILAHDIGFTKFLAGTMELDPTGSNAMEDNRHPITEAGIGELIDTVQLRWSKELDPAHSIINHRRDLQVGSYSPVSMIESIHPERHPEFLFHKVRLFIDPAHGLPIRFEAYDWPAQPQAVPELLEEYTYLNLKTNVGLKESDFDPSNSAYSFGRF